MQIYMTQQFLNILFLTFNIKNLKQEKMSLRQNVSDYGVLNIQFRGSQPGGKYQVVRLLNQISWKNMFITTRDAQNSYFYVNGYVNKKGWEPLISLKRQFRMLYFSLTTFTLLWQLRFFPYFLMFWQKSSNVLYYLQWHFLTFMFLPWWRQSMN